MNDKSRRPKVGEDQICSLVHLPDLKAYWIKKNRFTEETYAQIDWSAMAHAMRYLPINKRHHVIKHTSGWCLVGKMAKHW
jgi:hypothetical protein